MTHGITAVAELKRRVHPRGSTVGAAVTHGITAVAETVRSLEVWVQCEGIMPDGSPAKTVMTFGYDPARKKFVGTFVGSMMTHLWVYEGELDAGGKVLTLDAEGPSFANPGKTAKYQDTIEFVTPDHRTLSSRFLGDDGQWHHFMTAHYRRKK